jgi:putative flavoprotein involved in K+ transport
MRTATVIIGAGHAGVAMSRRLTERSIDHVVLERGEVANAWRTERWSSLRLLTPNWQTRLPSFAYRGDDPDGFMTAGEVTGLIARYATAVDAPVHTHTTVRSVQRCDGGYDVVTDRGTWTAPTVVLASGACNVAHVPSFAADVPRSVTTLTPMGYHGAGDLPDGGVLVVGAGATAVQLADEIHRSGRPVTLAAGEHVRLPRTYRGCDIFSWMESTGVLDQRFDAVDDIIRARHVASPQLVGSHDRRAVDLNALSDRGVRIVGRLGRVADGRAQFAGSLANMCALADLKMHRLLDAIDAWAGTTCAERPEPTRVPARPTLELDLTSGEIRTIVWATGFRPDHSWLHVPVFDRRGQVKHDGGVVTGTRGLYLLGMPFLRRRRSTFIHGALADTRDLAELIRLDLARRDCDRQTADAPGSRVREHPPLSVTGRLHTPADRCDRGSSSP